MKTNSLLSLVSLAVLATCASAATQPAETAVYVLPTYVVTAPVRQPAEQKVQASLEALRQQARIPAPVASEMPLAKCDTLRANLPKLAAPDAKTLQVAKL